MLLPNITSPVTMITFTRCLDKYVVKSCRYVERYPPEQTPILYTIENTGRWKVLDVHNVQRYYRPLMFVTFLKALDR
jgi:hypothetical protein